MSSDVHGSRALHLYIEHDYEEKQRGVVRAFT